VVHYSLPASEGDIVTGWIEPDGTIRMWSHHHSGTITVDADAFGAEAGYSVQPERPGSPPTPAD